MPDQKTFNLQTATLPATAVMGILMVFGGWWINAQGDRLANAHTLIYALEDKVAAQELNVAANVAEIQTAQAVNGQKLEQLNATIQRLLDREAIQ